MDGVVVVVFNVRGGRLSLGEGGDDLPAPSIQNNFDEDLKDVLSGLETIDTGSLSVSIPSTTSMDHPSSGGVRRKSVRRGVILLTRVLSVKLGVHSRSSSSTVVRSSSVASAGVCPPAPPLRDPRVALCWRTPT